MSVTLWSCDDDDDPDYDEVLVSFEDKLTAANTSLTPDADAGDVFNEYYRVTSFTDSQNLVECSHYFSSWGFGGGLTYTNTTDVTTPGYANISAITGTGKFGSVYLTGCTSNTVTIKLLKPAQYEFEGAWVTNTTYAYLAVKDGDDGNATPYVKGPFASADNDWFKLTAIGYNAYGMEVGRRDFYLADYRNGKSTVVNTWEWFDWSDLGDAVSISFEMSSSDTGQWGMNTPAYFCLDGITLSTED